MALIWICSSLKILPRAWSDMKINMWASCWMLVQWLFQSLHRMFSFYPYHYYGFRWWGKPLKGQGILGWFLRSLGIAERPRVFTGRIGSHRDWWFTWDDWVGEGREKEKGMPSFYFFALGRRLCLPVNFTINLSPLNIDISHSWWSLSITRWCPFNWLPLSSWPCHVMIFLVSFQLP